MKDQPLTVFNPKENKMHISKEVLNKLNVSTLKIKELPSPEIDDFNDFIDLSEIDYSGRVFLVYATTTDGCVALNDHGRIKRCPFINFSWYLGSMATFTKNNNKILVLGEGEYKEHKDANSSIAGVTLAVLSSDADLVQDPEISVLNNIEELERHIKAATAVGYDVFLNVGPKWLDYFSSKAYGEFVLSTDQHSNSLLRGKEIPITFKNPREFRSTINIADGVPIRNISRKPCKIKFNILK